MISLSSQKPTAIKQDTSDIQTDWYLMQMKPAQHYRGLNNLMDRGYECYSPEIIIKKRRKGKMVDVTEPLFPSYVFIYLPRNCNWQSISCTRGVAKFIRFGAYPTVVPVQTMNSIRANVQQSQQLATHQRQLKPGDRVMIKEQSFQDFEAVFKCEVSQDRSIILIKHLEQVHEISIKNNRLKLVSAG